MVVCACLPVCLPAACLPPACLQGKLRVLYECFPMAMLMEQAGGRSTTGTQRSLEMVPDSIHGR